MFDNRKLWDKSRTFNITSQKLTSKCPHETYLNICPQVVSLNLGPFIETLGLMTQSSFLTDFQVFKQIQQTAVLSIQQSHLCPGTNVKLESCNVKAVGVPVFIKTNSSLCDLTYALIVGVLWCYLQHNQKHCFCSGSLGSYASNAVL